MSRARYAGCAGLVALGALVLGCPTRKGAVPDAGPPRDPCAAVTCEMGTHCELRTLECGAASCPKKPDCVPDPDENPCNLVTCTGEQVCVVESGKGVCLEGSDESEEIPADGAVPEGARPAAKDTRPATP